jgi:hypothetical protein
VTLKRSKDMILVKWTLTGIKAILEDLAEEGLTPTISSECSSVEEEWEEWEAWADLEVWAVWEEEGLRSSLSGLVETHLNLFLTNGCCLYNFCSSFLLKVDLSLI